jgi:hypothetical protein
LLKRVIVSLLQIAHLALLSPPALFTAASVACSPLLLACVEPSSSSSSSLSTGSSSSSSSLSLSSSSLWESAPSSWTLLKQWSPLLPSLGWESPLLLLLLCFVYVPTFVAACVIVFGGRHDDDGDVDVADGSDVGAESKVANVTVAAVGERESKKSQ